MVSLVHELFDPLLELRQHFGLGFLAGFYVFQTLFCIIDALRELLFQLRHPIDKTFELRIFGQVAGRFRLLDLTFA